MIMPSLPRRLVRRSAKRGVGSGEVAKAGVLAGVALVAAAVAAVPLGAQTGPAPDFSNIEIHSLHIQGNVWMVVGGPFNAAVSIGNDGVLVVDTMVEPLADRFLAEVKKIAGDQPIRYIIHTHFLTHIKRGQSQVTI